MPYAIEANGCFCGGSMADDKIDVVVELGRLSGDPDGRFARVTAWLDARIDVAGWRAGPLVDLSHGDFADDDGDNAPQGGAIIVAQGNALGK